MKSDVQEDACGKENDSEEQERKREWKRRSSTERQACDSKKASSPS